MQIEPQGMKKEKKHIEGLVQQLKRSARQSLPIKL